MLPIILQNAKRGRLHAVMRINDAELRERGSLWRFDT
jgi:hypothetical protein